jgi:hypothetical protein
MPSNKRVFIAVAAKEGSLEGATVMSLIQGIGLLGGAGYQVDYAQHLGSAFIGEARNALVEQFMCSQCMDLIFVDADVGFQPDALVKLMSHDVQVVGGVYPFKSDDVGYPVTVRTNGRLQAAFDTRTGLIVATMVPAGLLRINRTVFNTLQADPNVKHIRNIDDLTYQSEWKYFQTGFLFEGNRFWGEDTFFCRICRDNNIPVWLEPNLNMTHTGKKTWSGNYHEYLMSQETPTQKLTKVFEGLESGPAEAPLLPKVDISLAEYRPEVLI